MNTNICPKCNTIFDQSKKFCGKCGVTLVVGTAIPIELDTAQQTVPDIGQPDTSLTLPKSKNMLLFAGIVIALLIALAGYFGYDYFIVKKGVIVKIDGKTYTVIKKIKGTKMIKGEEQGRYMILSRDGQKVAYGVSVPDENMVGWRKNSLWVNGTRVSQEGLNVEPASYSISHDGSFVAYSTIEDDGKMSVWINNKKFSPQFSMAAIHNAPFSPDGNSVAYWASTDNRKVPSIYVNDRKMSPESDLLDMVWPVLSPDGKNVAYMAYDKTHKRMSVWINDKKISPEFDLIYNPIKYDGISCEYMAKSGGKFSIWVNDKKIWEEFNRPSKNSEIMLVSHDRKIIVWRVERSDKKHSLWINEIKVTQEHEWISYDVGLSPDGSKVAFFAPAGNNVEKHKVSIWINDKKMSPEFDEISVVWNFFTKTGRIIFAGYDKMKDEILIMEGK